MSLLFTPLTLKSLTLRNRAVIAPMCQYSSRHGLANDFHLVHLGRFALGGFGAVMVEATAVTPAGRISYGDMGLWAEEHIAPLARIAAFCKAEGAAAAIQLAHAGRKAATPIGWRGGFTETAAERHDLGFETWVPVAPSAVSYAPDNPDNLVPHALSLEEIAATAAAFAAAARRADAAGFDIVELHGAHGYLISQFLSPHANHRTDCYGGSRDNRMRFAFEVTEAVRAVWPDHKPLFMRISAIDGSPDGWTIDDSIVLARGLKKRGIDLVDCSAGGFAGNVLKPGPLYQVPFAKAVRATGLPTMAVGLISTAQEAETILAEGSADLVALGRGALEDPNWAVHAHHTLDGAGTAYDLWPIQARNSIRSRDRILGLRRS